jgi:hypothetical protein
MPTSFGVFDRVVSALVERIAPGSVLDIGTGAGKYGTIVRAAAPNCRRIGLEVEESYISRFNLASIYDEIWVKDAARLMRENVASAFDLVTIGDCIEHLPKSLGLDLLNFLTYRSAYTLVLSPEFIVQDAVDGIESEAHVSVWSEEDFRWHDHWAFDNCRAVSLCLMRGYRKANIGLRVLVDEVNKSATPIMDFDGKSTVRNVLLRVHSRPRVEIVNGHETSFRP